LPLTAHEKGRRGLRPPTGRLQRAIYRRAADLEEFDEALLHARTADVRPLLSADEAEGFDDEAARSAFRTVFVSFIKRFAGAPWARTKEMAERFSMPQLVAE
jgi:hypothetical protein